MRLILSFQPFYKVLSTIFVSVSIVGMTISTLPSLQYKDARGNTIILLIANLILLIDVIVIFLAIR